MRQCEQAAPGIAMDGPQAILDEQLELDDCDVVVES